MTVFDFAWTPAYRAAALPFGVTPGNARVEVRDDGSFEVRFGIWRLRTEASNVASAEASGGFAFVKTAGPPHLSLADRGITFATNGDSAVCLKLLEPVPGIDVVGVIKHPGITLTVSDPVALCDVLGVDPSS